MSATDKHTPLSDLSYGKKIELAISAPVENGLPETAPVVAAFLDYFFPAKTPDEANCFMTSMEIVQVLEDTCSLTTKDVALTMTFLGYRLRLGEGKGPEWAMMDIPF